MTYPRGRGLRARRDPGGQARTDAAPSAALRGVVPDASSGPMRPVRSARVRTPRAAGRSRRRCSQAPAAPSSTCGATTRPGTRPRPGCPPAGVQHHSASAMAPALAPQMTAPRRRASRIARHAPLPGRTVGSRSGSPPGRTMRSAARSAASAAGSSAVARSTIGTPVARRSRPRASATVARNVVTCETVDGGSSPRRGQGQDGDLDRRRHGAIAPRSRPPGRRQLERLERRRLVAGHGLAAAVQDEEAQTHGPSLASQKVRLLPDSVP